MTIIIQAALVRPAISVAANAWKSSWSKATTRLPLVTIAAMPLTTNDIASVPMSGLIRNWVTIDAVGDARPPGRPRGRPGSPATGDTDDAVVSATAPDRP